MSCSDDAPETHPELEEKRLALYSLGGVEKFPVWSRHTPRGPNDYETKGVELVGTLAHDLLPGMGEMGAIVEAFGKKIFDLDQEKPDKRVQVELERNTFSPVGSADVELPFARLHEAVIKLLGDRAYEPDFKISILHSPAGSNTIQMPHRDLDYLFDLEGNLVRDVDPYDTFLVLVALEAETSLIVYFGSHLTNGRIKIPHRVVLKAGDVIRFHPRVIHCGDMYRNCNTRIHYYMMPESFELYDETHFPEPWEVELLAGAEDLVELRQREGKRQESREGAAAKANRQVNAAIARCAKATYAAERLASSTDPPLARTMATEGKSNGEAPAAVVPEEVEVVADEDAIGVAYVEEGPGWESDGDWWVYKHKYNTRSKKMRLE